MGPLSFQPAFGAAPAPHTTSSSSPAAGAAQNGATSSRGFTKPVDTLLTSMSSAADQDGGVRAEVVPSGRNDGELVYRMTNRYVRVVFDARGRLISLFDRE